MSSPCPHCGAAAGFEQRERGPHIGLYCRSCGRWVKWLPQGRPIIAMPFGRYKGCSIKDLPRDYLNWMLENVELRGSLLKALEAEYERRGTEAAA